MTVKGPYLCVYTYVYIYIHSEDDVEVYKQKGLVLLNETDWMRPMLWSLKEKTQSMEQDKANMMVASPDHLLNVNCTV